MTCPKCGSDEAVSKAEAWDAACEVPPKTHARLARLESVARAAVQIVAAGPQSLHGPNVVLAVDADMFDMLTAVVAQLEGSTNG